jgi:hypothetical protein
MGVIGYTNMAFARVTTKAWSYRPYTSFHHEVLHAIERLEYDFALLAAKILKILVGILAGMKQHLLVLLITGEDIP